MHQRRPPRLVHGLWFSAFVGLHVHIVVLFCLYELLLVWRENGEDIDKNNREMQQDKAQNNEQIKKQITEKSAKTNKINKQEVGVRLSKRPYFSLHNSKRDILISRVSADAIRFWKLAGTVAKVGAHSMSILTH